MSLRALVLVFCALAATACDGSARSPAPPGDEFVRVVNDYTHGITVSVDQAVSHVQPCSSAEAHVWHGGAGRLVVTSDAGTQLAARAIRLGVPSVNPIDGTPYAEIDIGVAADGSVSTDAYRGGVVSVAVRPSSPQCAQYRRQHPATASP